MMKSVLALSALFAGALAQQNCTSQTGGPFQFCTQQIGISLYWNWTATTVEMLYEAPDDGWKAVGFTSGSGGMSMLNSNVVLGCFAALDATPAGADGQIGNTRAAPQAMGNQNLAAYNQTRMDNLCAIRFTRPTQPMDVPATQHLTNRLQRTIAARGGPALAQHMMARAFDLNFATGEDSEAAALAAPKVLVATIAASVIAALW